MSAIPAMMDLIKFEQTLKAGDAVTVRWTNCFCQYEASAVVVRVNRSSIRVELTEAPGGYRIGQQIVSPSMLDYRRYTVNNCVLPPTVKVNL